MTTTDNHSVDDKTVFKSEHLTITHQPVYQMLVLKWRGYVANDQFKLLAKEIINAIESTGSSKILSDNTDWKVISPADHGWAASYWFPLAEKKGVKKMGTLQSKDYFNRASEKSIVGMADIKTMSIQNFSSEHEARGWLN